MIKYDLNTLIKIKYNKFKNRYYEINESFEFDVYKSSPEYLVECNCSLGSFISLSNTVTHGPIWNTSVFFWDIERKKHLIKFEIQTAQEFTNFDSLYCFKKNLIYKSKNRITILNFSGKYGIGMKDTDYKFALNCDIKFYTQVYFCN